MAHTVQKQRVVGNPGRRAFGYAKKKPRSSSRKRNPGEIVGFRMAGNPGRKAHMARRKHKHHNPGHMKHRRHRRNPGLAGVGELVTNAVFVVVGAVGSKLGAQMVLGSNNNGLIGYAGNAAVGAVMWFIADRVMKNREAAKAILSGTVVEIVLRVINDYTPLGQYVSGLGMGDYQMQSFVTPQVLVDPTNSAAIAIPSGFLPPPPPPPPAVTMKAAAGMAGIHSNVYGISPLY